MSLMNIITTRSHLYSNRIAEIKELVKIIAANTSIQARQVPSSLGERRVMYCVSDNPKITDVSQFNDIDIKERFKTKNKAFTASYYEIWDKDNSSKENYILTRIYFHLYLSDTDKEYILLHTDPTDPDKRHGIYKRSPHLHVKHSCDDVISHAHLALNINDYDVALSSLFEVDKCFKNHIEMLKDQIL